MSSTIPPIQHELIRLTDLEAGPSSSGTHITVPDSGQAWHPKLTPYRLLSILLPVCLGTTKAVALQQGKQNEPITLEWISGVVVFIVLFNTGTYERRPIQHIPSYLAWLFKYDCMDAVWWLRLAASRQALMRPGYISDEVQVVEHGTIYMLTSYRLLVCATVVSIGMLKAALTYSGISTGATWIEWILGVVISSALYIIGLYESNTVGLWTSFFGTNRADVLRRGVIGTFQLLGVLLTFALMSLMLFAKRPYRSADAHTGTELPFILPIEKFMMESVYVMSFILGAVMLFKLLGIIRESLGDRAHVPLRIRIFALWIVSFPWHTYAAPTSTRPYSLTSALVQLCAAIWSLICALRHLLCFLGTSFLITRANSFSRGPGHHITNEDLFIANASPDASLVGLYLVYTNQGVFWTVIIVPAGIVLLWSLKEMIKSARDQYTARPRIAPLIREAMVKAREKVQRIKRRAEVEAVRAVLGLSGLSRVDEVHYSFRELVWTLHDDGVEIPVWQ